MSAKPTLKFEPFTTIISPAFWVILSRKKLDELGLYEDEIPIWGYYLGHTVDGASNGKFFLNEASWEPFEGPEGIQSSLYNTSVPFY